MIAGSVAFPVTRALDYLELMKIRLVSLVLLSTAVGFYLASVKPLDWVLFFTCILGTGLVAAGSMSLNQWMEREADAKMSRTLNRPLPAGRLHPAEPVIFGALLSSAGLAVLFFGTNRTAAFF